MQLKFLREINAYNIVMHQLSKLERAGKRILILIGFVWTTNTTNDKQREKATKLNAFLTSHRFL